MTASVRATRDVPVAPGRVPGLGHALRMRRDPLAFLSEIRRLGPVVRIHLGPRAVYVVNDEHLVRQIFVTDARSYDKGVFWEKVGAIVGNGLANSSGATHLRQRRLMQPLFHRQRIARYADTMARDWAGEVAGWQPGQVLDVPAVMTDMALNMVVHTVFSSRLGDRAVRTMRADFPGVQDGVMWRTLNPLPLLEQLPLPGNRRFAARIARIWDAIDDTVTAYRADGTDHGDLLSMLLATRDEDTGEGLTDEEIRDQVLTIALAAGDTTANAMAWACFELGRVPAFGARIAAEVAEVAGGRPLTAADLPSLTYTDRFAQEVFRYYAFWMLMRRTLVDVDLGGLPVPAGGQIIVSPLAQHRDPAVFADALTFDPDRWIPERAAEVPRTSLFPFGAGARQCIGDRFAWTEVVLGLATICRRWELRPVPGQETRAVYRISVNPAPLRMTVHTRE